MCSYTARCAALLFTVRPFKSKLQLDGGGAAGATIVNVNRLIIPHDDGAFR